MNLPFSSSPPTQVTPSSKVVGDLAQFMVQVRAEAIICLDGGRSLHPRLSQT